MRQWFEDLRYAARSLATSPGFSAVAVVTLALGIGANTAMFSLVHALFVRALPFESPERIVQLRSWHAQQGDSGIGPDDFRDWHEQNTVFGRMTYSWHVERTLRAGSMDPFRVHGREVKDGFFEILGTNALIGRTLIDEDHQVFGTGVAVLSHRLWQRCFDRQPGAVGRTIVLDGKPYTVVGVMPKTFRFNEGFETEYWAPLQHRAVGRQSHMYTGYARLKPGVSLEQAQEQMSAISKRLESQHPSNTNWGVRITTLRGAFLQNYGSALTVISAALVIVLLVGCANVANLLLARSANRVREIAVRVALGAGAWRIMRLLLAESFLLSTAASVLGLLLAIWWIDLASASAPSWMELRTLATIDGPVLAFTAVASALTTISCGILPAVRAAHTDIHRTIRNAGSSHGHSGTRMRAVATLVCAEMAMAVILITSAGLLKRSLDALLDVQLGFRRDSVIAAYVALGQHARYPEKRQIVTFVNELIERTRRLPGVISAGAGTAVPLAGGNSAGEVKFVGRTPPRDWRESSAAYRDATPAFFQTLGIPLRAGRDFTDKDDISAPPVVIVNESFGRRYFPGQDPLGQSVHLRGRWATIVGVVGDVRFQGPEKAPGPDTYMPFRQTGTPWVYLTAHFTGDPGALERAIRRQFRDLDPELAPGDITTMSQFIDKHVAIRSHLAAITNAFGAVTLLMAGIGLGGVMWYRVSRRTREIGIRVALGATHRDVMHLILVRGLRWTALGAALGLAAAVAGMQVAGSLLFGVKATDPIVLSGAVALLLGVAVVAMYIPARRAASIRPIAALRQD